VWTTNTPSLNSWVVEAYISVRFENGHIPEKKLGKHYGEDLRFEQDAVIIQKFKKKSKKIKKLAKLKTWKGDLGNRERPGGPKTRKGGPGKN